MRFSLYRLLVLYCTLPSVLSTVSSSSVLICHFSLILLLLLLLFSSFAPSSISACFPLPLLPGIAHPTLSQSEVSRCSCGSLKAGRSKVGIRPKQRDGMMMCSVCVCVYLVLDVLKLMCRETWGAIGKNTYTQTHTHWNIFIGGGGQDRWKLTGPMCITWKSPFAKSLLLCPL